MALKRQFDMSATFSMASLTDVIFLLLIFFMVTSTFVFPNALEVNLPESSETTALKPTARIYIDADGRLATMYGEGSSWEILPEHQPLETFMTIISQQEGDDAFVALYADVAVPYGKVVELLNLGHQYNVKVVLATSAPSTVPNGEPTAQR